MFQELDATLKNILDDPGPATPVDLRDADVSFETPDKDYKPTQAALNLFLHGVKENRELRDNAPVIERRGDLFFSQPPPLRVDCTYIVTAWSQKTSGAKAEEEHRLLGQALRWFSRFPVIQREHLTAGLADQPYALPTLIAQMPGDANLGQFWSALGIAPRPSFYLTVTIAMRPLDETNAGPPVQTLRTEFMSVLAPQLTGLVKDQQGKALVAAQIRISETGQSVTTDASGRYVVFGLAFGTYTFVVQMAGFQLLQQAIQFQADRQLHDLILSP